MIIVILIPTYNERENIAKLLERLIQLTKKIKKHNFKILVVDDNSPDGTGQIVGQFQKKYSNIHLLSGKKEGLGRAMVRGYIHAMKKLMADVVVSNEADFAFDFKHLPFMLKKIEEGYDVVIASRHVGVGKTTGWTLNRRLNHWVANTFFASWIAGVLRVHDKNGAFRAIRVKGVLDQIGLNKFKVGGFAFFFFSIYKLSMVTTKIWEFPCVYKFRVRGESKITFNPKYLGTYIKDVIEYIKLAFQVRSGSV